MGQDNDPRDWRWASSKSGDLAPVIQWSRLLSENIAEMAVESPEGHQFRAAWTRFGLDALEMNILRCGRQSVLRSDEMVRDGAHPFFELLYARRGPIQSDHNGIRNRTPQGGFLLLDDLLPYNLDFPEGSECLSLRLPQEWAEEWIPGVRDRIGLTLAGPGGWGRPLEGLLSAIADCGPDSSSMSRETLAEQLGAMMMVLGSARRGSEINKTGSSYRRIFDVMQSQFRDQKLDPEFIARELALSKRQVHRVLAEEGTSFGRLLNEIRIAEAEALLGMFDKRARSIGEIAWEVGYSDQGHFARVFRSKHGLTPSEFRDAALR